MTTPRTATDKKRPLEILGISEAEERAYRWLITHHAANMPEIARALALSPGKTQRLLDAIETKGLATHAPERPRRYIPASPDIALTALALHHQEELQRAEGTIQELQEQAAAHQHSGQEQMIELINNPESARQIVEQMTRTARQEIVALVRPPMLVSRLDLPPEQDQFTQREARTRGVRLRSIADAEFLALPGAIGRIHEETQAGEEIRVVPHLPFKMVLTDRRIAIVPLNLEQSEGPALLIRSSPLLEALYALFEILWERAAPISFTNTGVMETGTSASQLSQQAQELIQLMAAGLNDKSITHELEIAPRTLNRRIVEIMKTLGVRTRFQMGWLAALHLSGVKATSTITKDRPT